MYRVLSAGCLPKLHLRKNSPLAVHDRVDDVLYIFTCMYKIRIISLIMVRTHFGVHLDINNRKMCIETTEFFIPHFITKQNQNINDIIATVAFHSAVCQNTLPTSSCPLRRLYNRIASNQLQHFSDVGCYKKERQN